MRFDGLGENNTLHYSEKPTQLDIYAKVSTNFTEKPKKNKMYNYPPNNFLYSGYRIETIFSNGEKNKVGIATGFVLEIGNGIPFIITNRHAIDLDYKQSTPKYKDFKLVELKLTSRRQDDTEYSIKINPETKFYIHDNIENDVIVIHPLSFSGEKNTFHYHFTLNI